MPDRPQTGSLNRRRRRRIRPPLDQRDWMVAEEVAEMIGCSVAIVHRFSNGEIAGAPKLRFLPRGAKARVFLKEAVRAWMNQAQGIEAAYC